MKQIWTILAIAISMIAISACDPAEDPTPKEITIENLEVPEMGAVGETMTITGTGFAADAVLAFEMEGNKVELPATATDGGVTVELPADMPRGHYSVTVAQEGATKLLAEDVWVTIRKTFKSATLGLAGEYGIMTYGWNVTRTGGAITKVDYTNLYAENADSAVEEYIDTYEVNGMTWTNTRNDSWMAFNTTATYTEENGKIASATAHNEEYGQDYTYVWNYNENGYLQNITHNEEAMYEVVYDDAQNITAIKVEGWEASMADYEGASEYNHPYAQDVMYAIASVMQYTYVHHHYMLFNGQHESGTGLLPTSIDYMGYGDFFDVTYEFDEDGYVKRINWTDSMYADYSRITISYEE